MKLPNCFFSALSFSVTLLIFNFLTLWFWNFFVRHTTICLQVEELATIEFYWLGGGEMLTCCSTLHCRFFPGHKHPIELLLCCPMELFLKMPAVGVMYAHLAICFMESSRFLAHLLSVVKVCIIWKSRRSEKLYPRSVAFPRIISIMVLTFGLIA